MCVEKMACLVFVVKVERVYRWKQQVKSSEGDGEGKRCDVGNGCLGVCEYVIDGVE